MNFKTVFEDFLSIFYPRVCAACEKTLDREEEVICLECFYSLPETNFHNYKGNPLEQLFWGKIRIEDAAAFYYYSKKGKVQKLIHNLKYQGHKEVGLFFGKEYGKILKNNDAFRTVDVIIPVPLHIKKERKRGYNQSEYFAKGLSESMEKPIDTKSLFRIFESESQTKNKKRYAKYQNVRGIFKIIEPNKSELKDKHVLLVDDVITTGSTIEESANALSVITGIRISVASIAFAGL